MWQSGSHQWSSSSSHSLHVSHQKRNLETTHFSTRGPSPTSVSSCAMWVYLLLILGQMPNIGGGNHRLWISTLGDGLVATTIVHGWRRSNVSIPCIPGCQSLWCVSPVALRSWGVSASLLVVRHHKATPTTSGGNEGTSHMRAAASTRKLATREHGAPVAHRLV